MDSFFTAYHYFHSSVSPSYIIWFVVKIGTNLSWSLHYQARYMSTIIGVSVPFNASANWTGPKSSHLAELFFIARFRTMLLSRYSSWFWARACQGRRSFPRSNSWFVISRAFRMHSWEILWRVNMRAKSCDWWIQSAPCTWREEAQVVCHANDRQTYLRI